MILFLKVKFFLIFFKEKMRKVKIGNFGKIEIEAEEGIERYMGRTYINMR